MQISIGCDHAGFELKEMIKKLLEEAHHEVSDEGAFSDEASDYPEYAGQVAKAVSSGNSRLGILVCGTGIGMAMAANKVTGVRAATCHSLETARMSRKHNDANVLTIGSRVISSDLALGIVHEWLDTDFDGGRHQRRVEKIASLEEKTRH